MRIVVINHITLDGVMQGPGRPDEDTRDGFTRGGWAEPNTDDVMLRAWGKRLAASGGLLLGRRTYQDLLGYWNTQDSPFRDALNNASKYIASNTLAEPLPWPNSTLLSSDILTAVAKLKEAPGDDLHIMGSGALIQRLSSAGLIDEYMLSIHPLVLGTGHRLFAGGSAPTRFSLVEATPTTTGVIIATYRSHPFAAANANAGG
jgi:dihydrofolate reductase